MARRLFKPGGWARLRPGLRQSVTTRRPSACVTFRSHQENWGRFDFIVTSFLARPLRPYRYASISPKRTPLGAKMMTPTATATEAGGWGVAWASGYPGCLPRRRQEPGKRPARPARSEEHTSELQSL